MKSGMQLYNTTLYPNMCPLWPVIPILPLLDNQALQFPSDHNLDSEAQKANEAAIAAFDTIINYGAVPVLEALRIHHWLLPCAQLDYMSCASFFTFGANIELIKLLPKDEQYSRADKLKLIVNKFFNDLRYVHSIHAAVQSIFVYPPLLLPHIVISLNFRYISEVIQKYLNNTTPLPAS